jgi:hypothetical protein
MGQGFCLGVVAHIDPSTIVPLDVHTPAFIRAREMRHADGIRSGVISSDCELVSGHGLDPLPGVGLCVAMRQIIHTFPTASKVFFQKAPLSWVRGKIAKAREAK